MAEIKITNAKYWRYPLNNEITHIYCNINDSSEQSFVPIDENNKHYQAIQEWVAEGNTIQDAD
jgi:hypothetical protein